MTRLVSSIVMMNYLLTFQQPINYNDEKIYLINKPQHVYTIEANMNSPLIYMTNALSYGKIYGFEKTSEMAINNNAYAAVNGMFYDAYGHHIGGLVLEGKIISLTTLDTPLVVWSKEGQVIIDDISISSYIEGEDTKFKIDGINRSAFNNKWILYSEIYGRTTRITRKCINYVIKDNYITNIIITNEPVEIPKGGYVLTRVTNDSNKYELFSEGELINIQYITDPNIGEVYNAFQSGGWLVKDGNNVAKSNENFLGNTLIPNPRTLIGVTEDNKVIVKVIDGRQSGYSKGVSGHQAAELMIEDGCLFAVYLDGGASSTMFINDSVVNRPSNKNERKVAHSLIFNIEFEPLIWQLLSGKSN